MKYTVVQWVGEDGAVSVVSEKDITSPEDEIVEGGEVVIMMRGENNKARIFQAVVLKVFGKQSDNAEFQNKHISFPIFMYLILDIYLFLMVTVIDLFEQYTTDTRTKAKEYEQQLVKPMENSVEGKIFDDSDPLISNELILQNENI